MKCLMYFMSFVTNLILFLTECLTTYISTKVNQSQLLNTEKKVTSFTVIIMFKLQV